jgi:uncharacterized paraquat-inducible protein A
MSVSFIYQNLTFYYRIDSHSSSMVFIAWGCRELPISGEAHSKEHMMEDIKAKLKQYYRNRKPNECKDCGLTNYKMEGQSTCPECLSNLGE